MDNKPETITVIEFWRRGLNTLEYMNSRLYYERKVAVLHLIIRGFKQLPDEDDGYYLGNTRAIITTRSVE